MVDSSVPDLPPPHPLELLERIAALETENALLRQKIDLLVRKLFGAKSQQLYPAQLLLLLQGMDEQGAERSETVCRRQTDGWRGSDIKSPGARGGGGATALNGPIASA